jgi:hypothetical protein
MTTTGATLEPNDPSNLLTSTTSAVQTAGASDVLMSTLFSNSAGVAHRIKACATGTIGIKRINDSAFVSYPVFQGDYIDGRIIAVGSTSDGTSSGMTWIAEV